ncbi:MAG: carboxypeptidase-like regulatory domain-containing protein [Crocinitomicaceae bacterium]|nr:carboxypeptidase-like regulatory domain-containing protein [Crocinitomicaceae bacterium]
MVARFLLLLTFAFAASLVGAEKSNPNPNPAGTKIVNRIISVDVKNKPLGGVLKLIEQKAYFKFSYNADILDEAQLVSLLIEKQTVAYALKQLFNESIRYKEAGNHIILLKNDDVKAIVEDKNDTYYFSGKITDATTGAPISGASIYDVEARQASVSDANGNYHLILPKTESMHGFYFSKLGYYDTTLVVIATISLENSIALSPMDHTIEKLPSVGVQLIEKPIEERPIGKQFVPEETYIHSENLKAIQETRAAQISFLPSIGIGSNLSTNGLIVNHFSLNVLAGYSNGVAGCEIGGILNLTKNDVNGAQIGGIGNLVGGKIYGVQVGGISNVVLNDIRGVQVGGINNLVRGHVEGVQIGGISNMISGGFDGLQLAGINNFARRSSNGFQIAGINNVVADTLYGGQIAGIGNWARRGVNSCQISGFVNLAYVNQGAQITGFYNYANVNDGVQIGIVNSSLSGKGVAIGLVSFCKEGYRATEISANEVFPINLIFKSGVNKLYNTYSFGIHFVDRPRIGVGLGLGNKTKLGKRLSITTELSAHLVQFDNFDSFQGNSFYRIATSLDIRLAKWLTFYLGPDFNFGTSRYLNDEGIYTTFINYEPFSRIDNEDSEFQYWFGAQVGLRFGIDRNAD